jgi:putative glutamine amidotransferase
MATKRVGVTLDAEEGGYSAYPWYALRANYAQAVADAGGVPLALPHLPGQTDAMLDAIDALIVTGGAFDVSPALYGVGETHPTVTLKQGRTAAELALLRGAMARGMPVLGICGGMQLLAVALGGTLIQHIPDSVPNALPHEQPNPRHEAGHEVRIESNTRLQAIVGTARMVVNSSHHQAVRDPGRAIVNAVAPDGVIEGIEDPAAVFLIGVQWHPEFHIDAGDRRLFAALVAAA